MQIWNQYYRYQLKDGDKRTSISKGDDRFNSLSTFELLAQWKGNKQHSSPNVTQRVSETRTADTNNMQPGGFGQVEFVGSGPRVNCAMRETGQSCEDYRACGLPE